MNSNLQILYNKFPAFIQNITLSGYALFLHFERYSGRYRFFKELLNRSQWYSESDLLSFQEIELRKLINHAYNTVPYYNNIFKVNNLVPTDIQSIKDLQKLPVLTKKDIKFHFNELRSRSYKFDSLKKGHTSGTTGSPLEVLYNNDTIFITYASLNRQYQWAGISMRQFGDKIAVARGNVIVPLKNKRPPFWRYNFLHNQLLLSSFHLSNINLPYYFKELKRFSPKIIDGYPSTLYILAKFLKNNNSFFPVKAIITSSETLFDFQREIIEERFRCKIFDYYALAERVVFATECDAHQGHHLNYEYGITEILNNEGSQVTDGTTGRLVGTSLHNYGMPLIRYVTDDRTALKPKKCSCGRALPLMEDVTTKAEDIITLKDGRLISSSTLTHPFKPMNSIDGSQIIQEDFDYIRIRLIPNSKYKEKDSEHLLNEFQARLGSDVQIKFELIDNLPKTKSGKFRWVISKVSLGI